MFGIHAQWARRRRRVASRTSRPLFAACFLSGLLLIASIVPGSALAGAAVATGHPHEVTATTTPPAPPGAPGGATMATATALVTDSSYRGTIGVSATQAWYRLEAEEGEKVAFEIRGETSSCPVRASFVDASGGTLEQLISTARESLPFLVSVPQGSTSASYLRIDISPSSTCSRAGYVFRLLFPTQPTPCGQPAPPSPGQPAPPSPGQPAGGVCASKTEEQRYGPLLQLETSACDRASAAVNSASNATGRERGEVERGRGSRKRLEQLERAERNLKLKARHDCGSY